MKTIKAIIVDDEALARRGLALRLSKISDIEIVAQCKNGKEALTAISEFAPDILFVDLRMPGMSGLELLKTLGDGFHGFAIMVTASKIPIDEESPVNNRVEYLLKPIQDDQLKVALGKARRVLTF